MIVAVQDAENSANTLSMRQWVGYAVKAAVLLCLLGAVAKIGPHMHALGVALLWVLLICISALGCAYFRVIRKASRHYLFEPGRLFSRWNNGRILAFSIAFVTAAICVTSLFSDVFRWKTLDWVIIGSAAVFYPAAYFGLRHLVGDQFADAFRQAGITRTAIWATIAYLCAAWAIVGFAAPAIDYPSAYAAFAAAQQEFDDSPVELLRQIGIISSLADGLTNWGSSQAALASPYLYAALKIFLSVLSLTAIGSMLGACSISTPELKRMFSDLSVAAPISDVFRGKSDVTTGKTAAVAVRPELAKPNFRARYAIAATCMPMLMLVVFLGVNTQLQQASDRGETSLIENIARDAAGCAVYVLDGKIYDDQAMQAALDDASDKMSKLSAETKEAIIPLINASFDARMDNIDGYLDDYYSLPADYERLISLVGNNIDDFVAQRLQEKLDANIDDSELISTLEEYDAQRQTIVEQFNEAKASCELDFAPEWLITSKKVLDQAFIDSTFDPDKSILSSGQRLGVSAASGLSIGVATNAITKKVVEHAAEKQFFGKIATRIASVLGTRATGGVVGAAMGTAAGPLGTVAGIAVGTAAGVGVDYALLKVDESQNRESYKEQIAQAIEEERSDMLSMFE